MSEVVCPVMEGLEMRCLLSAAALVAPSPIVATAAHAAKAAAPAQSALKGTYTGTITDANYGSMDMRLVISKVNGKEIIGKLWLGTKTGTGVQPFTFDCSNTTFTLHKGNLQKFTLAIPGQYGKLTLDGTITQTKVGTTKVTHMTGKFHAFFAGGQPYTGNYSVDKI